MIRKILSVVLIVIGSIIILGNLLSSFTTKAPESADTAFMIGYYTGKFLILLFGAILIIVGVQIRRKLKRKKIEKELLDTLPKS